MWAIRKAKWGPVSLYWFHICKLLNKGWDGIEDMFKKNIPVNFDSERDVDVHVVILQGT